MSMCWAATRRLAPRTASRCRPDRRRWSSATSSERPGYAQTLQRLSRVTRKSTRLAAPEQRERARVAVQERRAANRPDLAVAEESAERRVAEVLAEQPRVVVGLAEQ